MPAACVVRACMGLTCGMGINNIDFDSISIRTSYDQNSPVVRPNHSHPSSVRHAPSRSLAANPCASHHPMLPARSLSSSLASWGVVVSVAAAGRPRSTGTIGASGRINPSICRSLFLCGGGGGGVCVDGEMHGWGAQRRHIQRVRRVRMHVWAMHRSRARFSIRGRLIRRLKGHHPWLGLMNFRRLTMPAVCASPWLRAVGGGRPPQSHTRPQSALGYDTLYRQSDDERGAFFVFFFVPSFHSAPPPPHTHRH